MNVIEESIQENANARWVYFGGGVYQDWYIAAARPISQVIGKETKATAIVEIETELKKRVITALEASAQNDSRRYLLYRKQPLTESVAEFRDEKERIISIDKTLVDLLALHHLAEADKNAAEACLRFSLKHNNRKAVEVYQESLSGVWDSLVLLWKSNGTSRLEEELSARVTRYLMPTKAVASLSDEIQNYYRTAAKSIFC